MHDSNEVVEFTAKTVCQRTDLFLSEKFMRTRSYMASLIDSGFVLVNGRKPKKSDKIKAGDLINIVFPPNIEPDLSPVDLNLKVVYETDRYAVVDKPANLAVHHSPGIGELTLVNGILAAFDIRDENGIRPGIVHRLDKNTTGLIIIAKDSQARSILSDMFQSRTIDKYYYAVCYGTPKQQQFTIDAPIARDRVHRQRMAVLPEGKSAQTVVEVLNTAGTVFDARIKILTGRTHQIRVHMKHMRLPLLGDDMYSPAPVARMHTRPALHAQRLVFTDPFNSKLMDISSDIPVELKSLLQVHRVSD